MRIAVYLKFNGRCEEALNVYKELFNAELICMHKFSEVMTENKELTGKVFHAELKIKEFYIYMSDTDEELDYERQAYKITIECDTFENAKNYYNKLLVGGKIIEPLTKMPWGDIMGHLRDSFGITWDIVYCG
jgi:PhnB protein